jgi:predicted GH43/DUF377 family glycosyl hydrolase
MLKRYKENPILKPLKEHPWESQRVFNCAAIYENGKVHIVYRAQGENNVSRLGYASTSDGFHIDERLHYPIFEPSYHYYENHGCEDPRITKIGNTFFMTYTAYGKFFRWRRAAKTRLAQIGLTTISVDDFLNQNWNWDERIYPYPRVDNKNCVLFPEKIKGKYVMYHRIPPHIWIGYSDNPKDWSASFHKILMSPRKEWEAIKVGAGAPPIKIKQGWLFVYHAVDDTYTYRLGLALIDKEDPEKIIRLDKPILEPKEDYEKNIVFTCGAIVMDEILFVYYGADDRVIGVATAELSELLYEFEKLKK